MIGLPNDISKELARFLEDDEKPIDFRKEPWSYFKRSRWVVLTNRNIYLIKKIFFGFSFDITQIVLMQSHFEMIEGVLLDTIYIRVPSEGEHVINFFSGERDNTMRLFREIEEARENLLRETSSKEETSRKLIARAELEALARTFYENKITSKEYEKKKKNLIDRL